VEGKGEGREGKKELFLKLFLVPSWVNEKMDKVSVNKSVWGSTVISLLMQFVFGYFAAITFRNPKQNSNILNGTYFPLYSSSLLRPSCVSPPSLHRPSFTLLPLLHPCLSSIPPRLSSSLVPS
jgi:hypothetical protein